MRMLRMSAGSATLLIVDDDREFLASLAVLLATLGYAVRSAHSVSEALDLLDTSKVDLVISDIRMPDVDGLDLIRILRHRFPRIPTLLLSGACLNNADVIPREVKRILSKPVTLDELQRAIENSLPGRSTDLKEGPLRASAPHRNS